MLHVQYWMSMSHISYLATSCQDRTLCDFTVRIIRIGTVPQVVISGFYILVMAAPFVASSQIAKTYIIMYITILTLPVYTQLIDTHSACHKKLYIV